MDRAVLDVNTLLEESKTQSASVLGLRYGLSASTIRKKLRKIKIEKGIIIAGEEAEDLTIDYKAPKTFAFGDDKIQTDSAGLPEKLEKDTYFDNFYKQYKEYLGWQEDPKDVPSPPDCNSELTIVAGDMHAPYHNDEAIRWMVNRTQNRAKRLIIAGDLADMFNFSKYMKFKKHFDPLEEIVRTQGLLKYLSESYPEVVLLRGNHDDRFIKYMTRKGLPAEVIEVFDYLHGAYSLHPVYVMARSLKNVKVVEPMVKEYAEFAYLHQQGDAIVSHAEKYSSIPNKSVGDVIQSLKSYHEPQGIIKPFKIVIQAHTHQAGKTWNDFNVVGIENGCLCHTPDYAGDAKRTQVRASILGYTELYQTDGVTDLQRTNFVPYKL